MLKWLFNLGKKEEEKKQEIDNLKKKAINNFKKNLEAMVGDKNFKCAKISYEYKGEPFLNIMINNSLNSFLTTANRIEKNIIKGKIAKNNFKIISYFHDYHKKNKKVKKILDELQEKEMISLEQLEILKEEYKKYNKEYWEKDIKNQYKSDYKDYELGSISKEELEKRRRYYYGD